MGGCYECLGYDCDVKLLHLYSKDSLMIVIMILVSIKTTVPSSITGIAHSFRRKPVLDSWYRLFHLEDE